MSFHNLPIHIRRRLYNCKSGGCVKPTYSKTQTAENDPNKTQNMHFASLIKTASIGGAIRNKMVFVNKKLNVYGKYEGVSGGSGSPPRNSF